MDELQEAFRARLPSRIDALEAALGAVGESPDGAEAVRRLAHGLKGSGTTFGFPEITAAAEAVEKAKSKKKLTAATQHLLDLLRHTVEGGEAPAPVTILIVDDDRDTVHVVSEALATPGRRIVTADSVARATERLSEGAVDLIILGLVLPDEDGRRLIGRLRSRADTAGLPIFVISARFGKQVEAECYALGADSFFEKPVDPDVLAAAVAARLERQAAMRASQLGLQRLSVMARMPLAPPPAIQDPGSPAVGGTVFLVEDDELIASVVKHRLEREGFTVVHYADGAMALEGATGIKPVLAILDVKLPGMDGFELLGHLRGMEPWANVPVMILTALGDEGDLVRGFSLGASDYMQKPFSPAELVARVRRLALT